MKEYTTPPCESCGSHDVLEEVMEKTIIENTKQHNDILNSLDKAVMNIRWMNLIGKWVLATMLGYFVGIAYYIFSDKVTHEDIASIKKDVSEGEKLHYKNENHISEINAKLGIIKEILKHQDEK